MNLKDLERELRDFVWSKCDVCEGPLYCPHMEGMEKIIAKFKQKMKEGCQEPCCRNK